MREDCERRDGVRDEERGGGEGIVGYRMRVGLNLIHFSSNPFLFSLSRE